jgi:hypothetical protein
MRMRSRIIIRMKMRNRIRMRIRMRMTIRMMKNVLRASPLPVVSSGASQDLRRAF